MNHDLVWFFVAPTWVVHSFAKYRRQNKPLLAISVDPIGLQPYREDYIVGYSVRLPLMKMLLHHFHRWKAFFIICSNETLPKVSRHYSGFAYLGAYPMAVLTIFLGMVFLPTSLKLDNFAIVGPLFFFAGVAVLYIVSMRRSRKAKKQLKAMRYR